MLTYMALIDEPAHKSLFETIYERYRVPMMKIAYSVLHDHHWAEDAVSEAFLKIAKNIKKISSLSGQERKAYLVILTRNSALDIYRQRLDHETPIDFAEELSDAQSEFDLDERVFREDGYARLLEVIGRLDPIYRDVMLLHYVYEHTAAEVGEILGVQENTIHARLSRGRKKLQKLLEEEGIVR